MSFQMINIENQSGVQIIKIPKHLQINDNKVYLKKMGSSLYIIPFHKPWDSMIESINEFSKDFMQDRTQPEDQKRESLD